MALSDVHLATPRFSNRIACDPDFLLIAKMMLKIPTHKIKVTYYDEILSLFCLPNGVKMY